MEAIKDTVSSIPNKLFLSGSDIHTPVDGGHTPSSRPPMNGHSSSSVGTFAVKAGLAQMLKICFLHFLTNCTEVSLWTSSSICHSENNLTDSAEQARIAEEAGACAVMALERVPADIRQQGGVARMSDPKMIKYSRHGKSPHRTFRRGSGMSSLDLVNKRSLRPLEWTTLMNPRC